VPNVVHIRQKTSRASSVPNVVHIGQITSRASSVPNFVHIGRKTSRASSVPYVVHIGHKISRASFVPSDVHIGQKTSRYSDSQPAGRSGDRIPVGMRFSAPVRTRPGGPPTLLYNGYIVFPGGKAAGVCR